MLVCYTFLVVFVVINYILHILDRCYRLTAHLEASINIDDHLLLAYGCSLITWRGITRRERILYFIIADNFETLVTMNDSQTHLHSENFDLCRICLLEPESNRDIKFFHIFSPNNDGLVLSETIMEFLDLIIDKDDVKPKIICQNCHKSLLGWVEMKKRATESQIVINYIEKKRYAAVPRVSSTSGLSALPEAYQSSSSVTNISTHSRNTIESSHSYYSITRSKSSISNNSKSIQNNLYSSNCGSSTNQNNHNQSTISTVDDLTSESDDDTFCQVVNVAREVICISDSESSDESNQNNFKTEYINNDEITNLNYCSICKKKKNNKHDCSQYNKEFSTCLVPNCNILSRSTRDFTPHYRQHIGIPAGGVLCRRCFRENKKSERDENGCHTNCNTANLFKCYTCNINFINMAEFAFHKLKTHNGRLINSSGNYLCFYCEKSSPDLMNINEHIKHCLQSQTETISKNIIKQKEETENKITVGKNYVKNIPNINKEKQKTLPRSSTHLLFTCLKPSCNLIFQNFAVFKFHHREHFDIGNDLMCWQCCSPFSNMNSLRTHQVKGHCRTPGMFKCFECSEKYNDLQSLSIHKFISHNGELITNRKNKKTMKCPYCKIEISILNLKSHLIKCQSKKDKKIISKPNLIKKVIRCGPFKCEFCFKVCLTAAALSSHIKTHSNVPRKRMNKKSKFIKRKMCKLINHSENENNSLLLTSQSNESIDIDNNSAADTNDLIEIDEEFNALPCTSQSNESIKYDDFNFVDTRHVIKETDEELNILPSASQNNEIIQSDNSNMTNLSVINQTDDEVHSLPSTPENNGSVKSDDYNLANSSIITEIDKDICTTLPHASQSDKCIKSDNCNINNSNTIKAIDEKINKLQSTSKTNGSIKSNNWDLANSSVITETDKEPCTALPETSQSDGSIKSDCGISNMSHTKEINLRSSTSSSNETDHEIPKCVDKLFSCSKCPKKFSSQRGLSLHHSFHLTVKTPKTLVQNYYCTKCKEYFTCSGFGEHWKLSHGKKLPYHKSKRYSCSKCLCKFIYKMALTMHKEHKHGDITTNKTSSNSVMLSIKTTKDKTPSSIVLPVKTNNSINGTLLDNFSLPLLSEIQSLSADECENPVEDQKNSNEKTNTLLKVEKAKLDNNMKQNNEVNEFKINGQDDNTENTHEKIIQNANPIKITDVTTNQLCDENAMPTINAIVNEKNEENPLSSKCETMVMEKKENENEKNINSVVEENQNCKNKILLNKKNENITESSSINKTSNVKQEFLMPVE